MYFHRGYAKMTRYKHAFDEDGSSVGSVQLSEGVVSTASHIRYRTGSNVWRTWTTMEKLLSLAVLFLLLLIAIIGLLSAGSCSSGPSPGGWSGPIPCLDSHCVQAAATILRGLDPKTSPCDDFYQFACGGWMADNPIPDGRSMWGTFSKLEQDNQLIVKRTLEKPYSEMKSKAEEKAKRYYLSCLDVNETMEALGPQPMLDLLGRVGGWNITPSAGNVSWSVADWKLQDTLHRLHNGLNMGGLFSWTVGEDDRNSSRNIIQIDQGGLALPTRDNYLNKTENEKILAAYLEYMTKVGVLLGGEENSTRVQMQAVIDFETRLAEITEPPDERRDEEKMYHIITLAELDTLAPFIKWVEYFSDALRLVERKVTQKERVVVYAPEYLEKLNKVIEEHLQTNEGKTVLNNYLVWQTVRSLTVALSKAFRDAYRGLRKALVGSEGAEEPWRYCVIDTNNVVGFATGAMFVREVFSGKVKAAADDLVDQVRNAFKTNLKQLTWMDEETNAAAQEKADSISKMIGFPEYILNPDELDKKYQGLEFRENEYFNNNVAFNKYNLRASLKKLDEPVNKTRWSTTPSTVNAFYTPTKNQIAIPAGILQPPFYDIHNPNSLNYGAMGVIMGHELTHAFDDQGREYDANGNMHKWWNNETIDKFKERASCLTKQYSAFKVNNKSINGNFTLGENIADNGGLKAAFHAYELWSSSNPPEPALPGLNLTQKQLFFLGFAQVWCSVSTQEAAKLQIDKDPHAPSRHRVIAPLSNLPEFAREFNCRPDSPMNPPNKCELW